VMVVRSSFCGCDKINGRIFKVGGICSDRGIHCVNCGAIRSKTPHVKQPNGLWVEISRLKRIEPPQFGDSLPTRKDIKEPA